ncbi:TetR family transcriptional regulator [Streptomyces pseudovenezuelae]|uniref:AcrR family transcriptional regulator n=1 Tax=Streptomyces pseudovenezuelae TaxID=67350 RepID=A0ABT6M1M2_9ACTN|nr:TetR family transcriptional regulator [Streptomyces pseudovenezuelae]MDH6222455.1 AcrR family transcriptional regulator [Streptomyces pseudovenezuelae]
MGLRELKKQQMREQIAETAWRLFSERGFDGVTVVEVARAAQVSEATVFNYFPHKEDLFYSRFEAFTEQLVEAVRTRERGESALAAFRRRLLAPGGLLTRGEAGDAAALTQLRTVNQVIADSPALQAREQCSFTACADTLAATLASESGQPAGDVTARVVANALLGVHRALVDHVRHRVLADDEPARLAAEVHRLATRAFALLEVGLRDYAAGLPHRTDIPA